MFDLLGVVSFDQSYTILLGLTPADTDLVGFWNCRRGDDSTKLNKSFDLLRIQSNVQDPLREVSRW